MIEIMDEDERGRIRSRLQGKFDKYEQHSVSKITWHQSVSHFHAEVLYSGSALLVQKCPSQGTAVCYTAILCAPGLYTIGLNKSQKMPKNQQSKLKVWSKLTPMLETSESRYAFIDKSCTKSDKCSHYTVRSPVSCTRTEVTGDLRKKSPFQNACGHPFHALQYNHILTIIFGRIESTTG